MAHLKHYDIGLLVILQVCSGSGSDPLKELLRKAIQPKRSNEKITCRTRVVRIFPYEQSYIRLISALVIEENENRMARQAVTHINAFNSLL